MSGPRLPDFLIVGTARGGTTALYRILCRETAVFMPEKTELHHFSYGRAYKRADFGRYLRHFAAARPDQAAGEKSPSYFWFPETAARIREALPDVRIVCTLRDPVERALSDFAHSKKLASGETALVAAIEQGIAQLERGQVTLSPFDPSAILWKGLYRRHLSEYLAHFPASRVLLIDFNDLAQDPRRVIRALSDHLGVSLAGDTIPVVNASDRSATDNEAARALLARFYEGELQFLDALKSAGFDLENLAQKTRGMPDTAAVAPR